MIADLTFNKETFGILKGFKFDINWKDHTNEEDESQVIITIPEVAKEQVEEFVTMILRAAEHG